MKKKFLFMLPCIAAVAFATFVGTKFLKTNVSESNGLLMANVEALSLEGENGGEQGMLLWTACSKKPGTVFCSPKRGCRKWAVEVTFGIGATPSGCPNCPDGEDYEWAND